MDRNSTLFVFIVLNLIFFLTDKSIISDCQMVTLLARRLIYIRSQEKVHRYIIYLLWQHHQDSNTNTPKRVRKHCSLTRNQFYQLPLLTKKLSIFHTMFTIISTLEDVFRKLCQTILGIEGFEFIFTFASFNYLSW